MQFIEDALAVTRLRQVTTILKASVHVTYLAELLKGCRSREALLVLNLLVEMPCYTLDSSSYRHDRIASAAVTRYSVMTDAAQCSQRSDSSQYVRTQWIRQ